MITVKDIFRHGEDYLNKEIELFGWVRKIRDQKKFGFIELNDGSFFKGVQIVFEEGLENFDEVSRLSISSTIKVKGSLCQQLQFHQQLVSFLLTILQYFFLHFSQLHKQIKTP